MNEKCAFDGDDIQIYRDRRDRHANKGIDTFFCSVCTRPEFNSGVYPEESLLGN